MISMLNQYIESYDPEMEEIVDLANDEFKLIDNLSSQTMKSFHPPFLKKVVTMLNNCEVKYISNLLFFSSELSTPQ